MFAYLFQISEVIFYLENRAYVFRSYEVICDAAFEVIHSSKHGDKVKSETANAIGELKAEIFENMYIIILDNVKLWE